MPQAEGLASDQAGRSQPGDEAQDQDHERKVGAEDGREEDEDEEGGHGVKGVDDAHQHRVRCSSGDSRNSPVERAEDGRHQAGGQADLDGALAGDHEPAQDVEALAVGAQGMGGAGRQVGEGRVDGVLVRYVNMRPHIAEQDQEDEQAYAQEGDLAFYERRHGEAERAPRRMHFSPVEALVGGRRRVTGSERAYRGGRGGGGEKLAFL